MDISKLINNLNIFFQERGYFFLIYITTIISCVFIFNFISKKIFLKVLNGIKIKKSYKDVIISNVDSLSLFNHISFLAFFILLYNTPILHEHTNLELLNKIILILVHTYVSTFFIKLITLFTKFYTVKKPINTITIYTQIIQLLIYLQLIIMILAILMGQSIITILTMLGTFVTVLLFIFRDTILSFMSGIQLQVSKSLHIGDWIEMPPLADGNIVEMGLYNIKIENWDKTVTTVPSIQLASNPFKNWKNMYSKGGRRIKRRFSIHPESVAFIDRTLLQALKTNPFLTQFLEDFNSSHPEFLDNNSELTNLQLLRHYIRYYLSEKRNDIWTDKFSFLIRHLQASSKEGIPLELYAFTKTTDWAIYEKIQSEIMEHLFATLPLFHLRPFLTQHH